MAKSIEQSLKFCPNCNKTLIHFKEVEKISLIVHLLLVIITAGFWLFVLALIILSHVMSMPIGGSKSTCSQCGLKHK